MDESDYIDWTIVDHGGLAWAGLLTRPIGHGLVGHRLARHRLVGHGLIGHRLAGLTRPSGHRLAGVTRPSRLTRSMDQQDRLDIG